MTRETVLVADDDDIRELVALKLENAGYSVVAAADGDEALAQVRSHQLALA